jgi:hypothetical protein
MAEADAKVCSVCGVKIVPMLGGDRVLFAAGAPGTRESLWAKVCRHTQKPGCINTAEDRNPPK